METKTIEIKVSGPVGCGKSHVLATIEKALKLAYGNDLMVASRSLHLERNLTPDDQMQKLNVTDTVVVLVE